MDRWKSYSVALRGGVIKDQPPLTQAKEYPGSLTRGVNIETSRESGGYRRINGFSKFDENEVPGTGNILGTFVYNGQVLACRNDKIYTSAGAGWTHINSGELNPNAEKYAGHRYNWGQEYIILCDQVNNPLRYDSTTLTRLATPYVPTCLRAFKFHMFFGAGNKLFFSAPNDETDYSGTNGAGEINVGFDILAIGVWRDQLYIFGRNNIAKVVGDNASNFVFEPVTTRIGIVHRDTLQEVSGDLLFLSDDGIRTVAGTERIGDVELGSVSSAIYSELFPLPSQYVNGTFSSVVVAEKGQYRLFPALGTETQTNTKGFVGCLTSSTGGNISYEWFKLQGFQALTADSDYFNNVEIVVHGGFDGYVYRQEQGNSLSGSNVVSYMELPYVDYGDARIRKTIYKVTAYARIEGQVNVKANLLFDYNSNSTVQPAETSLTSLLQGFPVLGDFILGSDELGADPNIVLTINTVGSGYTNTIIITSNDQNAPWTIEEIIFEYGTHGRR